MKPVSASERKRPDDEDLAAFCEGRLAEPLRQAVVERLATDPDYYRIYVDFQHILGSGDFEVHEDGSPGTKTEEPPETLPGFAPWRRWIGPGSLVASAVLFGAILALKVLQPPTLSELAAGLDASRPELRQAPGPTFLGPEEGLEGLTLDHRTSFHLGSLLLDLELSVAAGEDETAGERRRAIAKLLEGSVAADFWRPTVESQAFVDELSRGRMSDPFSLTYGMWARGLWLAVRQEHIPYLESDGAKLGAKWLSRRAPRELRAELGRLRAYLEHRNLEALDRELRRIAAARESHFDLPAFQEAPGDP